MAPCEVDFLWTAQKKPKWDSKAIMWFQGTVYSHVAIAAKFHLKFVLKNKIVDFPEGCIIHADDPGLVPIEFEDFYRHRKLVASKKIQLRWEHDAFEAYCQRALGAEYSDGQLIAIGAQMHSLKWLFRNGRAKSICSEWAGDVLVDGAGMKLKGEPDFDWTPRYLFDVLKPEIAYP